MIRARMLGTCVCTLMAVSAGAGEAPASTLTASEGAGELSHDFSYFRVTYRGEPGEVNRVTATYDAQERTFTLTDKGVDVIDPVGGVGRCVFVLNRVTCRQLQTRDKVILTYELGDRDDTAWLNQGWGDGILHGGPGRDKLITAGTGTGTFYGGEGDDLFLGGPGDDQMTGGPGADTFDGGAGTDTADYHDFYIPQSEWATGPVRVSADGVADDGQPGEGDDVRPSVEALEGTPWADVLIGGPGPSLVDGDEGDDRLEGGTGDDRVYGREGHDHLAGGPGRDLLEAGTFFDSFPDDDVVDARDGEADRYACGVGADVVLADAFDAWGPEWPGYGKTPAECETVEAL